MIDTTNILDSFNALTQIMYEYNLSLKNLVFRSTDGVPATDREFTSYDIIICKQTYQ